MFSCSLAVYAVAFCLTTYLSFCGESGGAFENPGNPPVFKSVNPGLCAGKKNGFDRFNFGLVGWCF